MTGFGGTTLSYDANGNLASDGTNTYTWDARNHLTAISGAAPASFTYDAFGRRASKSIGATTTQFLYDLLNPLQELNSSNQATANMLTGLSIDEYFTRTGLQQQHLDTAARRARLDDRTGGVGTDHRD